MIGSRTGSASGRGGVALAAVGAMVVTLFAMLGLSASPAAAADVITFRAATQATWNQTTARVTIPAAVREGDGMLLFVTTNKAYAGDHRRRRRVGPSRARGWRAPTPRRPSTAGSRRPTTRAATRPSPSPRPPSPRSPCSPTTAPPPTRSPTFASADETVNRTTHTTPASNVATAGSYVVSYWADKSASDVTGWTLPGRPDPAQHRARHRRRPHHLGRLRRQRARRAPGATTPRTATSAVSTAKATMWTVVLQADQTVEPERRPGGVVHRELPDRDLHGRRLRLDRHGARHHLVLRLGLRRRHDRHRRARPRTPTPPAAPRRSRSWSPTTRGWRPHRRPARPTLW